MAEQKERRLILRRCLGVRSNGNGRTIRHGGRDGCVEVFRYFPRACTKNRGNLRKIWRGNTSGSTKMQMVGQIQFPTVVCFLSLKFFFSDSSEICRLQTILETVCMKPILSKLSSHQITLFF